MVTVGERECVASLRVEMQPNNIFVLVRLGQLCKGSRSIIVLLHKQSF